jgi:hypothetical protein
MKNLFLFLFFPLLLFSKKDPSAIYSCAPVETKVLTVEEMYTVRDGDYFTGSTWNTGRVPSETDIIDIRHKLTSNNRVIRRKNRTTGKRGGIKFLNIDESRFVGSGMEVPNSDVGLEVLGDGQLILEGDKKTSWTNAIGSVKKGATSFQVADASGWSVGDVIVMVPTETPPYELNQNSGDYYIQGLDWNDATNKPIDPFGEKFEELTITSISGNLISIAQALKYDHLEVIATNGARKWTAEVMNLTRSFVIEGTEKGRAHVFIRSNKPQYISYVENRFTGPRKPGLKSGKVEGRYPWHLHHNMDASRGSLFLGVSTHHTGNHAYVFHKSFGITARDCIGYNTFNTPFWWDFQEDSRDIFYDHDIAARVNYNGVENNSGFYIGSSDNNRAENNVVVYAHNGDPHQQGGYVWFANDEGEWLFKNNLAHSNMSGFFTWQNSNRRHFIENYDSYNNVLAGELGAYGNTYIFRGGYHYRSPWHTEATQDNTNPHWMDITFDAGGREYGIKFLSSPFTANDLKTNIFVRTIHKGHTKTPVLVSTQFFNAQENGKKIIWLIDPVIEGIQPTVSNAFATGSMYGSQLIVQKGNSATLYEQAGQRSIPASKPQRWGTGMGLIQQIFNDANLKNEVVKREITQIKDAQLSFDVDRSITGVHYNVTSDQFSMRYSGFIEPQYSELTYFEAHAAGGVRLWIDNKLVLDRWGDDDDWDAWKTSSAVTLEAGKKYAFRFEHVNTGGRRGVELYWRSASIPRGTMIPQSQLYFDNGDTPSPVNTPPKVNAGADQIITDTFTVLNGTVADDKPGISGAWSQISGPSAAKFELQSDFWKVRITGLKTGEYTFRLSAKDSEGLTASDDMKVTVVAKPPIDSCKIFVEKDYLFLNPDVAAAVLRGDFTSGLQHWERHGKYELNPDGSYKRKINLKCAVVYKSVEKSGSVNCTNGVMISAKIEAGRFMGASQSTADALAIQELNRVLSKCDCLK